MTRSDWLKQALAIPLPEDPALVLDGCRRLLGPNPYGCEPGAVGDAFCEGALRHRVLQDWPEYLAHLLQGLGWGDAATVLRPFAGGASLYVAAPVDRLFTAAYAVEAAWYLCACDLLGHAAPAMPALLADLRAIMDHEANPALRALVAEACARGVDRLLDARYMR